MLELPMSDVSQCAVPQNEEIEIQFVEDNAMDKIDSVVSMRLYVVFERENFKHVTHFNTHFVMREVLEHQLTSTRTLL